MRIALLTLAVAALAFIGSIIWIFATKNGIDIFPKTGNATAKLTSDSTISEILKDQGKAEYRIKELEKKIDELTGKNVTTPIVDNPPDSTNTIQTTDKSGSIATIIPISAKFLSKIITKVNLIISENTGIYGLYIFDKSTQYSTYVDKKTGLSVIASRLPYASWLKNFQSLSTSLYTVTETKTYPFPSFYVNPIKDDGIVRIVMQVESQTLMLSIAKNKFPEFKTLLTKIPGK